jgi:hypothetical protein
MTDESDLLALEQSLNNRLTEVRRLRRIAEQERISNGTEQRRVADHALVRYLQRVIGMDTEKYRDDLRKLANEAVAVKDGEHHWHPSGVILVLGDVGQVITVLDNVQADKFAGRRLLDGGRATLAEIAGAENIVNLSAERTKRAEPDADLVTTDEYGRKFYKFAADYHFNGHDYGLHFWAADQKEAEARVDAMRLSLVSIGQLMGMIPA